MNTRTQTDFRLLSQAIARIGEPLRGAYLPSQYANVILPMLLLRRLDCMGVAGSRSLKYLPLEWPTVRLSGWKQPQTQHH